VKTLGKIGFIGLGAMGGAVARCLARGSWRLAVYDLSAQAVAATVAAGAEAASTADEAVSGQDVVFSCLPTPELVEAFWQDQAGRLSADTVAVDLSTIDPATSRRIADLLKRESGAQFVACTLGKTPALAEKGEIPVFVGGEAPALERIAPLLSHMSSAVFDMGSVEGATMFKLISNLVGMSNLAILAEGWLLAKATGIDASTFAAALATTGGWSTQAELRLENVMSGDFKTRFSVDLAAKDLRLSVDTAARRGVPTPVSAAASSVFALARAAGHGREDAAAVVAPLTPTS
jgi:3-hydroxyisobutyrate dehydrogenase